MVRIFIVGFLLVLGCFSSFGQKILLARIEPEFPKSNSSVKLIYTGRFAYSSCELDSSGYQLNFSQVDVVAKHKLGLSPAECTSTDTIELGTLEKGQYDLRFILKNHRTSPPLIQDTAYLHISITDPDNILEVSKVLISVYPNPARQSFVVSSNSNQELELRILDLLGTELRRFIGVERSMNVSTVDFPNGMYLLEARDRNGTFSHHRVLVQH